MSTVLDGLYYSESEYSIGRTLLFRITRVVKS